jgi:hypothetical protein
MFPNVFHISPSKKRLKINPQIFDNVLRFFLKKKENGIEGVYEFCILRPEKAALIISV